MFGQHYCHDRDGDSALKLHHQKLPVSGNQTGSTSCFIDGCGTLTFTLQLMIFLFIARPNGKTDTTKPTDELKNSSAQINGRFGPVHHSLILLCTHLLFASLNF